MNVNRPQTQRSLNISQEVITTIVSEAVKELPGIHSLANLPVRMHLLTPAGTLRPVRLTLVGDVAQLNVGVVVALGYKIKDAAEEAQLAIKNAVQDMTGMAVSKVNIYVVGVHLPNQAGA